MASTMTQPSALIDTAYGKIELASGGDGPPLLLLHRDSGSGEWGGFQDALAREFSVYSPSLPGFGASERPAWAREVRDLATITLGLVRQLGLQAPNVVGLGFGGWLAAEMAAMAPEAMRRLVLVGPMGVKPPTGEILDQFLITAQEYVRAGFSEPEAFQLSFGAEPDRATLELWEVAREMSTRVAWKPYMFNPRLPYLLRGATVPTLVVWGDADRVVPISCADVYTTALPEARLATIAGGGHHLEQERTSELGELVAGFLRSEA